MKIIRAEHLGMCFGVKDAIALAVETAERKPLTILGDLVHNETVLAELRARGIQFEQKSAKVGTQTVMVTAHGASERAMNETRQHGLNVLEATCPLVHVAHRSLKKLVGEGLHPVVIGKRDHVEVRGMTEDLKDFDVVLDENDMVNLRQRPRFGVIAQTTQPIEKVRRLVQLIRERFRNSEVRFIDTVCQRLNSRKKVTWSSSSAARRATTRTNSSKPVRNFVRACITSKPQGICKASGSLMRKPSASQRERPRRIW
jgi:4-hydroxy-3-methylbut-2-enyl diphosphate reductase